MYKYAFGWLSIVYKAKSPRASERASEMFVVRMRKTTKIIAKLEIVTH